MVVGAAAEQPRRAGQASKSFFRGHRGGDTGEIDPVPGVDGGDTHVDPEELRYAPQAPRRRRWVATGIALLVLALVAAVAGVVAYRWSQRQYYVAEHASKVAIYRGVQATIPGVTMNHVAEDTQVTIASLPDFPAEQVRSGISATSLTDARQIVPGSVTRHACARRRPRPRRRPAEPDPQAQRETRAKPSATPEPDPHRDAQSASPTLAPPDCIEATP